MLGVGGGEGGVAVVQRVVAVKELVISISDTHRLVPKWRHGVQSAQLNHQQTINSTENFITLQFQRKGRPK